METAIWIIAIALAVTALSDVAVAWERIILSSRQMAALQRQMQQALAQAQKSQERESHRRKQYYEGILGKKIEDATDAEVVAIVRGLEAGSGGADDVTEGTQVATEENDVDRR